MKTPNKIKIICTAAIALAFTSAILLFSGCSHLSNPESNAVLAIKLAAKDGTIIALSKHPEWRPHFELARSKLQRLLDEKSLSIDQLRSILAELPIKELKADSDDVVARILITDAEILFDRWLRLATPIEKVAAIPITGQAIIDGLNIALE